MFALKVEYDVLAHPANGGDASVLDSCGDLACRGLQRLRLLAEPDRLDYIPRNALSEASGDGFDLRKLGHVLEFTKAGYAASVAGRFVVQEAGGLMLVGSLGEG